MNDKAWLLLFAVWLVALVSTLGALFIGEVMGQIPCNLCWYQRIFMFPLAVILGISLCRSDYAMWIYGLTLSLAGSLLAAFHTLLYFKILPEEVKPCMQSGPSCSGEAMMLWGVLPLPLLSLVCFLFISIGLLMISKIVKRNV
ncbi:MAG: disulfide bond formation protein B [Micavibrio aeruginosavorus]|uniref:Disulfide bond formation protein B n=1 Tax=Micavibrio aeruginosavorus TaxID=349221 RepID=A0A2W5FJI7_9BACT|nr:MAG: disulfide bond formation protein B [Micavibrio aeruginosavorus]